MELITPHKGLEERYREYIAELGNEERYPFPMDLPYEDFTAYINLLADFAKGKRLLRNMVPNSTFWLVENNQLLAVSHLRHELNESLRHMGGHIGIGVRPSFRGKGLSKRLLLLTLDEAHKKGIHTVHIHCYKDNLPSVKMITSCGGVFSAELPVNSENSDSRTVQKYLIKGR